MAAYRCTRCDVIFEADEARCPTCLRKSGIERVEAPVQPGQGGRAGERHLKANAVLMTCFVALHAVTVLSVLINLWLAYQGSSGQGWISEMYPLPSSHSEQLGFFGTFACLGGWGLIGLLWAPLNAWALWKRKPWARWSTLLYWAGSLFTICCIPFGLYGLWSLLRPDVRAALESGR